MENSLREFVDRLAWRRIIMIFTGIFILYYYYTHKFYLKVLWIKTKLYFHTISNPFNSIGNIPNNDHSEVFELCVLAMILITIIGIVKLLRQRR